MRNWRHEELAIVRVLLAGAKVVTFVLVGNVVILTAYVICVDISRYKLLESITLATGDCPETVSGQSRDSLGTVPGQSPVPLVWKERRKSLTVDKLPPLY